MEKNEQSCCDICGKPNVSYVYRDGDGSEHVHTDELNLVYDSEGEENYLCNHCTIEIFGRLI